MAIKVRDRKRLWGRSASRCAFEDCRQELVEDTADSTDAVLVGQEAHIVARQPDGPRGRRSNLTASQRDSYNNLILVCGKHHTLMDNDVAAYPVETLLEIKTRHELWVRETLATATSLAQQAELERYAEIIDEWAERTAIDVWDSWSSDISNPVSPRLASKAIERLAALGVWMLGVIWPGRIPDLERALQNFHAVLKDFITEFNREADAVDRDGRWISALTARPGVVLPYHAQEREHQHADLIVDLGLELTRAGNHVCATVRSSVDAQFRLAEGALLMVFGHGADDGLARPEYAQSERAVLYPGLEGFRQVRLMRDLHCPPR